MFRAKILSVIFAVLSINLLINLVLTIITDPGHIPDITEWNMPEEKEESNINDNQSKKFDATSDGKIPSLDARDSV